MEKVILKTNQEVKDFLITFKKSYAFDSETTGLKYTTLKLEGISLCDGRKACYIPFMYRRDIKSVTPTVYWVNSEKKEIIATLKQMFLDSNTIIGHNLVFDMKVISKEGISLESFSGSNSSKKIYDTMVADHLIDENRPHGLKYLTKHILGYETTDYNELNDSGSFLFAQYAINDAVWTHELCMYQQSILKQEGLVPLFRNIEMPFQFVLFDMEINGMLIDVDKVKETEKELIKAVELFNEELHHLLGERCSYQADLMGEVKCIPTLNFNSGKVLQEILFDRLGLDIIETTPGGAPSTGKETINVYKKTVPFVALLNKYKIANKLLTAYFSKDGQIMRNIDEDDKVRPNIRDTGTVTGRLTMSSPNLAQLPKANEDFPIASRSSFIAGDTRKMFTIDFANQEGRLTAHLSNDATYKNQLLQGWDAHLSTANASFNLNIPEEALSTKHADYSFYAKKFKKERTKAKSINFALPYGGTEFAISKSMGVSKEEAKEAIDSYYKKYKGIKNAMDKAKEEIKNTGTLTTMFGRLRHFKKEFNEYSKKEEYPQKSFRQAFNFLIQSAGSDLMRIALNKTRLLFLANPKWDAKIHISVYDEGVFTCKEEFLSEASEATKHTFETCVKLNVPIVSDIGIGDNYEEAK